MLGTCTLSTGSCSFSTSVLSVGSHSITAVYSGSATVAASTSNPLVEVVKKVAG